MGSSEGDPVSYEQDLITRFRDALHRAEKCKTREELDLVAIGVYALWGDMTEAGMGLIAQAMVLARGESLTDENVRARDSSK